jgi:hypothetical protein
MGLLGNLSTAQIVEQLVASRRWLAAYTASQAQQVAQQLAAGQELLQGAGVEQGGGAGDSDSDSSGSSGSSGSGSRSRKDGHSIGALLQQPPRINNVVFMGCAQGLDACVS